MKIKNILSPLVMICLVVWLTACGENQSTSTTKETAVEHAQKHLDPNYVCPMHPSIIRDEPGSCPICGMDLVLREQDDTAASDAEKKILYYRHPHNPTITSDKPMQDEMGMDYVPIYDDGAGVSVKISAAARKPPLNPLLHSMSKYESILKT